MMKRGILALVCVVLTSAAYTQSIDIVPTWSGVATTDPRSSLTLVVRLENNLPDPHRLGLELELPEGWRRLVPDLPMTVQPGEASPRMLSIFVPQEARAAEYKVKAIAIESDTSEPLSSATFDVRVMPYLELQIDGLDGSTHVIAGESIEVPIRIANRSNTALEVNLTLESRSFYPGEFDGAPGNQITIASNESVRIVAHVGTPAVIARVENYTVSVVATGVPQNGGGGTDTFVRAVFRTSVEIIPAVSEDPPPFLTLPARIDVETSHTFSSDWAGNLDVDLSGGGFLDENGNHRLDFVLSPSVDLDRLQIGSVDDIYRMNYTGTVFDALLGDNRYSMSPLLGLNRSGRGVLGRYSTDPLRFTALYFFPKAVGPSESTVGGLAEYRLQDLGLPSEYRYRTTLGALSLLGSDLAVGSYHEYMFDANTRVEMELAGGTTVSDPFVWATTLGGSGSVADVHLAGSALLASAGFPGVVGDQILVAGSAATTISPLNVRVSANSSFQQQNPTLTGTVAAQALNAGLSTNIPIPELAANLSVGWRLRSRHDMIPDPDFSQTINSLNAIGRVFLGKVYLGLDAGLDVDRDALADAWAFSQRYNLAVRWAATPQTTYSANLAFSSKRSTNYPLDRSVSLGLVTNQEWGPIATTARTGLALNSRDGQFDTLSSFLAAQADVAVWGDNTISINGYLQYEVDSVGPTLNGGLGIGYTAPFNIPTTRKHGVGTITGYAYLAGRNMPVERVVIRVADRAIVTGDAGTFRLSALPPGEYFIEVDTSRVGRGFIPDLPTPIKIPVNPDETTYLDLPIVQGSTLSGTAALYAGPEDRQGFLGSLLGDEGAEYEEKDLVLVGGLSNAVVHFSRDDETRRVLTDQNGEFTLSDIRPGTWTVRITQAQLPRYHRLVQDEVQVVLSPGDEKSITFQIFPVRRPLTLLSVSDTPISITTSKDESAKEPVVETTPDDRAQVEEQPPDDDNRPLDDGSPTEPELTVAETIRAQLIRQAELRYLEPHPDSPQLLSLRWGGSQDAAARVLVDRIDGEFAEGEQVNVSEVTSEIVLTAQGRFLLGLSGSIDLTFLDLGEFAPRRYLVGVTVRFTTDENLRTIDEMEQMYHEMLALFSSRWKTGELHDEVDGESARCSASIGEVNICYEFDHEDGSIRVQYTDDWFVRAEASIIESR